MFSQLDFTPVPGYIFLLDKLKNVDKRFGLNKISKCRNPVS